MPRQSRVVAVGYPHHVTQRGNNREPVFLDREDHVKYLELLKYFTCQHQVDIWAYCLMTNHVHLLVAPHMEDSLARGIGLTSLTYTQYYNRKYEHTGRIWQNRFFSCIVGEDEYLWNAVRYIETNPLKSGMIADPVDYPWSSARAHCLGTKDLVLSGQNWLGDNMCDEYRKCLMQKSPEADMAIRKVTQRGRFYGCADTQARLEKLLDITLTARPRGRPPHK